MAIAPFPARSDPLKAVRSRAAPFSRCIAQKKEAAPFRDRLVGFALPTLLERADVSDELIDLLGRQLVLEGLHLLLLAGLLLVHPVGDGLLDVGVCLRLLPGRRGVIGDPHLRALVGLALAVGAVAGGALRL